ncbi:MAG: transglutaminase family protein [Ferrovum sp.]|nr:transglutaminase family protein [Ferrovum sp.]
MFLHIHHETHYHYDHPVQYSIQALRLTPRQEGATRVREWRLSTPGSRNPQTDAYGNLSHILTLEQPHEDIHILAEGWVEMLESAGEWLEDDGRLSVLAYLQETPLTRASPDMEKLAVEYLRNPHFELALEALMLATQTRIEYRSGSTGVECSAAETWAQGFGVCQDHAQVMVACCRAAGIPARYVSGYLYTGDEGHISSHAWMDAWNGKRWLSCDATHARFTNSAYCRLAVGRDYLDACPVRGIRHGGGQEIMSATVQVDQHLQFLQQ